jgi:hypothetical protein
MRLEPISTFYRRLWNEFDITHSKPEILMVTLEAVLNWAQKVSSLPRLDSSFVTIHLNNSDIANSSN